MPLSFFLLPHTFVLADEAGCLFFSAEARTLHILGKCSTAELHTHPKEQFLICLKIAINALPSTY